MRQEDQEAKELRSNTHASNTKPNRRRASKVKSTPKTKKPSIQCKDLRTYFKPTKEGAATKEGDFDIGISRIINSKSGDRSQFEPGSGDKMDNGQYINQ